MGQIAGAQPRSTTNTTAAMNVGATTPQMTQTYNDLLNVLNDINATDEQIRARLDAFRRAKSLVQQTLDNSRADLRLYLTLRQECIMTYMGYMDGGDMPAWLNW